jgi:pullulanase/glycogen debranching enzyme
MLGTLAVSAGVPMIAAGDELGRTQRGNNNAYCQDNEISWLDWSSADAELLEKTARLLELRREHPVLRPRRFPVPEARAGRVRLRWFTADGEPMEPHHWDDADSRTLVALYDDRHEAEPAGRDPDVVLVVLQAGPEPVSVRLPELEGDLDAWRVQWSSGPTDLDGATLTVQGTVIAVPA